MILKVNQSKPKMFIKKRPIAIPPITFHNNRLNSPADNQLLNSRWGAIHRKSALRTLPQNRHTEFQSQLLVR